MKEMVGGCCVCADERGWTENPLVYCDGRGCNVAVHQACYGIIKVPTGPWFCRKCESQERTARVRCELCPQREGALKKTAASNWCHVLCALYIPEAWFANVQTMEPIVLKGVPAERFSKVCYICEEMGREGKATTGACMQCNRSGCKMHFHVTCAQSQGLLCEESGNYMDNVRYCGYCAYHYKKLKKDSHLKTIPAFKPRPSGTPDTSPEKGTSQNKTPIKKEESEGSDSDTGSGDGTDPASGSKPKASTGKFTTANFTETTITSSPANLVRKVNTDSKDKSDTSPDTSPAATPTSTAPSSVNIAESKFSLSVTRVDDQTAVDSGDETGARFSYSLEKYMSRGNDEKKVSPKTPAAPSAGEPAVKRRRPTSNEKPDKGKVSKVSPECSVSRKTKDTTTEGSLTPEEKAKEAKRLAAAKRRRRKKIQLITASIKSSPLQNKVKNTSSFNKPTTPDRSSEPSQNASTTPLIGPSRLDASKISKLSATTENPVLSQLPASMEQLLERQWEQSSQFLMEQGQHFDLASLLNCLHQLRQENARLDDYMSTLTARREQLLAVNARLALPLTSLANTHPSVTLCPPASSVTTATVQECSLSTSSPQLGSRPTPQSILSPGRKSTGDNAQHSEGPPLLLANDSPALSDQWQQAFLQHQMMSQQQQQQQDQRQQSMLQLLKQPRPLPFASVATPSSVSSALSAQPRVSTAIVSPHVTMATENKAKEKSEKT